MASLSSVKPAKLILGFPSRPEIPAIDVVKLCSGAPATSSSLRCKGATKLQRNRKLLTVSATNSNSTGGKSANEGSAVNETSNAAQGPPLLTILAGFFVFLIVCWIIGSIIMWLISLIVNVPSPK